MAHNTDHVPEGVEGFSFDITQINALIEAWGRVHNDLIQHASFTTTLKTLAGPGDEGASRHMASKTRSSAEAYTQSNETLIRFIDNVIQNLIRARDEYHSSDTLPSRGLPD